jgi:predicted HAD superfamily phosphohydrolase YqeG
MERAYESNKSNGTDYHISQALAANGITISESDSIRLANNYFNLNRIKPEIIKFLNELADRKKVYLYTSLSRAKVDFIASLHPLSPNIMIFAREEQIESKPSIRNLQKIMRHADTSPERSILFGDNIAVDIMPAKLCGIKSVLVSNYVDDFIKL